MNTPVERRGESLATAGQFTSLWGKAIEEANGKRERSESEMRGGKCSHHLGCCFIFMFNFSKQPNLWLDLRLLPIRISGEGKYTWLQYVCMWAHTCVCVCVWQWLQNNVLLLKLLKTPCRAAWLAANQCQRLSTINACFHAAGNVSFKRHAR